MNLNRKESESSSSSSFPASYMDAWQSLVIKVNFYIPPMIHHLVLWKVKKENAQIMAQKLNALKSVITFAVAIEAGVNFNDSAGACDVGLYTAFKTKEDLEAYQKHPEHVVVAEWVKTVAEERHVADFET